MQNYEELVKILADAKEDAEKFYSKGTAAAGKRLRKAMQNVKVKAQVIRIEVSSSKKA